MADFESFPYMDSSAPSTSRTTAWTGKKSFLEVNNTQAPTSADLLTRTIQIRDRRHCANKTNLFESRLQPLKHIAISLFLKLFVVCFLVFCSPWQLHER